MAAQFQETKTVYEGDDEITVETYPSVHTRIVYTKNPKYLAVEVDDTRTGVAKFRELRFDRSRVRYSQPSKRGYEHLRVDTREKDGIHRSEFELGPDGKHYRFLARTVIPYRSMYLESQGQGEATSPCSGSGDRAPSGSDDALRDALKADLVFADSCNKPPFRDDHFWMTGAMLKIMQSGQGQDFLGCLVHHEHPELAALIGANLEEMSDPNSTVARISCELPSKDSDSADPDDHFAKYNSKNDTIYLLSPIGKGSGAILLPPTTESVPMNYATVLFHELLHQAGVSSEEIVQQTVGCCADPRHKNVNACHNMSYLLTDMEWKDAINYNLDVSSHKALSQMQPKSRLLLEQYLFDELTDQQLMKQACEAKFCRSPSPDFVGVIGSKECETACASSYVGVHRSGKTALACKELYLSGDELLKSVDECMAASGDADKELRQLSENDCDGKPVTNIELSCLANIEQGTRAGISRLTAGDQSKQERRAQSQDHTFDLTADEANTCMSLNRGFFELPGYADMLSKEVLGLGAEADHLPDPKRNQRLKKILGAFTYDLSLSPAFKPGVHDFYKEVIAQCKHDAFSGCTGKGPVCLKDAEARCAKNGEEHLTTAIYNLLDSVCHSFSIAQNGLDCGALEQKFVEPFKGSIESSCGPLKSGDDPTLVLGQTNFNCVRRAFQDGFDTLASLPHLSFEDFQKLLLSQRKKDVCQNDDFGGASTAVKTDGRRSADAKPASISDKPPLEVASCNFGSDPSAAACSALKTDTLAAAARQAVNSAGGAVVPEARAADVPPPPDPTSKGKPSALPLSTQPGADETPYDRRMSSDPDKPLDPAIQAKYAERAVLKPEPIEPIKIDASGLSMTLPKIDYAPSDSQKLTPASQMPILEVKPGSSGTGESYVKEQGNVGVETQGAGSQGGSTPGGTLASGLDKSLRDAGMVNAGQASSGGNATSVDSNMGNAGVNFQNTIPAPQSNSGLPQQNPLPQALPASATSNGYSTAGQNSNNTIIAGVSQPQVLPPRAPPVAQSQSQAAVANVTNAGTSIGTGTSTGSSVSSGSTSATVGVTHGTQLGNVGSSLSSGGYSGVTGISRNGPPNRALADASSVSDAQDETFISTVLKDSSGLLSRLHANDSNTIEQLKRHRVQAFDDLGISYGNTQPKTILRWSKDDHRFHREDLGSKR